MAKNIVLLSDGTGNSSAQLMKTNVWRVYEALQLTDPSRQVACYDDGVGTSSFKPLALAGGAFGVGLRRNVLRLYRFLCEHYDPGDRIYLFGFSRGAFTIRVLVGLICEQGIIKTRPTLPVAGASEMSLEGVPARLRQAVQGATAVADPPVSFDGLTFGSELARLSSWAYRDFRRGFNQTGGLVTAARAARDLALRTAEGARGLPPYDKSRNHEVEAIDFVGVWDTVDAYGLPVDELTSGIDHWVWPLSMPDLSLSRKVVRACHVLALDDERNTFHPVLWDEAHEEREHLAATHTRDERISQVWFAGMHSNVGGGYPDDALSYVSLQWMTDQATDRQRGMQLLFVPELLEHHTKKADPFGRVYDSRQGLKGYYRYNPRRIAWLTNGQTHERGLAHPTVTIPRPKIHGKRVPADRGGARGLRAHRPPSRIRRRHGRWAGGRPPGERAHRARRRQPLRIGGRGGAACCRAGGRMGSGVAAADRLLRDGGGVALPAAAAAARAGGGGHERRSPCRRPLRGADWIVPASAGGPLDQVLRGASSRALRRARDRAAADEAGALAAGGDRPEDARHLVEVGAAGARGVGRRSPGRRAGSRRCGTAPPTSWRLPCCGAGCCRTCSACCCSCSSRPGESRPVRGRAERRIVGMPRQPERGQPAVGHPARGSAGQR